MTLFGRSCYCGEISEELVGQTVQLKGWVQKRRDLGGLIFHRFKGQKRNRSSCSKPGDRSRRLYDS